MQNQNQKREVGGALAADLGGQGGRRSPPNLKAELTSLSESIDLSKWWKRLNDYIEPMPCELEKQFRGLPIDYRTGYPIGYISFALELDHRRAIQAEHARELAAQSCDPYERQMSVGNREFLRDLRSQALSSARKYK